MSELKPCPFCGSPALVARTTSSSDERCGYNFSVIIACSECPASVEVGSKHDKGGWCNESREAAIARAVDQWDRRTQPEATKPAQDLGEAQKVARYDYLASKGFDIEFISGEDGHTTIATSYCYSGPKEKFAEWVGKQIDAAIQAQKDGHG